LLKTDILALGSFLFFGHHSSGNSLKRNNRKEDSGGAEQILVCRKGKPKRSPVYFFREGEEPHVNLV
jgi:hypothetical protein